MTKTSVDAVRQLEIALEGCKPAGWHRDVAKNWLVILFWLGPILFAVVGSFLGFPWGKSAVTGGGISAVVVALMAHHVLPKAAQQDWHEARIREATASRKRTIEQTLSRQPQ